MKAALILNPIAGRGKPAAAKDKMIQALEEQGVQCELLLTQKAGDGSTLAREAAMEGCEVIIAAGGDGTVNEVANGLTGTGASLGIIPLGTVNVLARELKIPFNLDGAVETIAQGSKREIDLGYACGRYFTLMAGFGFDAEVVSNVLQPLKDIIGASAYVLEGLKTLASYRATEVTLEMPEETYHGRAFAVIIANAST